MNHILRAVRARPINIELGTNAPGGDDVKDRLDFELNKILNGQGQRGTVRPLWDWQTGNTLQASSRLHSHFHELLH